MMKLFTTVLIIGVFALAGGFVFFAVWDMPYASKQIEKQIPNEQFFEAKGNDQQ